MAHVLAGLLQVVFVWREIADIYSPAVHLYIATDDAFIILCLSPPPQHSRNEKLPQNQRRNLDYLGIV